MPSAIFSDDSGNVFHLTSPFLGLAWESIGFKKPNWGAAGRQAATYTLASICLSIGTISMNKLVPCARLSWLEIKSASLSMSAGSISS